MENRVYLLENLGCPNCATKMEKRINDLNEVMSATITFATKELRLSAEDPSTLIPKIEQICNQIENGIKVVEKSSISKSKVDTNQSTHPSKVTLLKEKKDFILLLFGAVLFIGIELIHEISHMETFPLPMFIGLIVAYLVLGGEILFTAAKNIMKGQIFDENFLMSIATLGAFAIGEYPEAVGVMLFFRIGEFFEEIAVEKSRSQIMDAVDLRPEVVQLVEENQTRTIPAKEAKVGDIVLVRPGDRIPLDGCVVSGESRIDTQAVTGEPIPIKVKKGSSVISGCVNTSGILHISVGKILEESMVSRILNSVENAAASKPKIDNFITRFARVYTPIVVLIALITAFIIPLITGQEFYPWFYTALSFLVMSCPCALVLSVPLAFFCGIGAGSKKGILFKGGIVMEALAKAKAIVMDKTGTITKGNFIVQEIEAVHGVDENRLLYFAASCELLSTHPIATSIVKAANERNIAINKPQEQKELAGRGIIANIDGHEVLCGNAELLKEYHISSYLKSNIQVGTKVLVSIDGVFAGVLVIADTMKEDAKKAIQKIKRLKLTTAILTGDSFENANQIADKTGIDEVYAKLLPEDKLNKLADIRKKNGSVMFVGDGINDAPVLAGADVGAAMGSGADAAIEAADVVFMNSNMEAIPEAIMLAKKTMIVTKQNVLFALTIKIVVMILGLSGIYANMWLAVFADTGVAFLCIINSVRILIKRND